MEHYKRGGEDNFLFFTVLNPMTKYQDYDYNSILYEERFDRKKKDFFSKKSHIHPYILHTNRLPLIEKTRSRKNELQQNIKKHTFIYNVLSIASKSIFLITYYIINTRKVV